MGRSPQADRETAKQPAGGRLQGAPGFWAIATAYNIVLMGATYQTPLYVRYQQPFGFDEIMLTVVTAVYTAGTFAALIFFGRLSDQIGGGGEQGRPSGARFPCTTADRIRFI